MTPEELAKEAKLGTFQSEVWFLRQKRPRLHYREIAALLGRSVWSVQVAGSRAARKVRETIRRLQILQGEYDPGGYEEPIPLADLCPLEHAGHLMQAMRGPARSGDYHPLDPVEGDRDRVTATVVIIDDVKQVVEDMAWLRCSG